MTEDSPTARQHKSHAPQRVSVTVVTVSDTRTPDNDESGALIKEACESGGHEISRYSICRDDPVMIGNELDASLESGCDVLIFNGGTGLSSRDVTIETVEQRLEKKMHGFGELFRVLSFNEIGSAAMMSRAVAGSFGGMAVFCLPGSPEAVALAMHKLILPEMGHIVGTLKGHKAHH